MICRRRGYATAIGKPEENHGKSIGKPLENSGLRDINANFIMILVVVNHRKTRGAWWLLMGFHGIYPVVNVYITN